MIFIIIISSIILILILYYVIFSYIIFKKSFKRGISRNLLEVDLSNTHYAPYVDILYPNMRRMYDRKYEEIWIKSFDNLNLYARLFNNNSKITVVMVHGYRALPYNNFSFQANYFLDKGYNVLYIYHRGHIYSEGKYITMSYHEEIDVKYWIEYTEKNISDNIILYGTSMGGGTATIEEVSNPHDSVKFIIDDCGIDYSYNALKRTLKDNHIPAFHLPLVNIYAKLFGKFSIKGKNLNKIISKLDKPILFIHSKLDHQIDYHISINLSKLCKSYNDVILTDRGGHTTAFMTSPDIVGPKVEEFIDKFINNKNQ